MKRLFLLFVSLWPVVVFGSNVYRRHDVRSGLSENSVRSIIQDSTGYMWFATKDGLNRFDGREMAIYGSSSQMAGSEHLITVAICPHSDSRRMWVATPEQLYLFDTRTETFREFAEMTEDGFSVRRAFSLCYDDDRTLWIGTETGLFAWNERTGRLRRYVHGENDSPHSLPNSHVWVVYKDSNGTMWVGTRHGLARYRPATDDFSVYITTGTVHGRPACNEITSLSEDAGGVLWVGTWYGGLGRFDKQAGEFHYYFGEGERMHIPRIRTIFQLTAATFFIGSDDGLFLFNSVTGECRRSGDELAHESIYTCCRDREGGIWIGTYFCGVNYLSPRRADIAWYYDNGLPGSLSGNAVSQFCEDEWGNLWIATENGGLNFLDTQTGLFRNVRTGFDKSYTNIHALLLEGERLWIGTFSQGLDVMNRTTGRVKNYRHDPSDRHSLSNDHVYSLFRDCRGTIWVGTLQGCCRFDAAGGGFRRVEELQDVFVYDIAEDSRHDIWIASKGDGIWRMDAATGAWRNYRYDPTDAGSPAGNSVICICTDTHGDLWFGTEGNGICRYDPTADAFVNYSAADGLLNSVVYGMLDDGVGNLWLSTNNGIIRYDPHQRKAYDHYTYEDGLQSNQFNFRSSLRTRDGRFWFGGVNGFNSFYPFRLSVNKIHPTVAISALDFPATEGHPRRRIPSPSGQIRIPWCNTSFDIHFECLSFVVPDKNRYAYKLENLHDDWIHTDQSGVSFLKLPAGRYTFLVKASNNDGYWSRQEARLEIEMLPPPWQTWWAKVGYLLLVLLLLRGIYGVYARRQLRVRERERKDLEQQREKELFRSKITFFTQVAHEIKTPVSLIKAPLEQIVATGEWNAEVEENLEVIRKNTDRLTELIRQLLDFRKVDMDGYRLSFTCCDINLLVETTLERFRAGTTLPITTDLPERHLKYAVDQEALTKILSNLLSNAMRYARTRIVVRLEELDDEKGRRMRLSICDDGTGIPEPVSRKVFEPFYQVDSTSSPGVGIGLSLVKLLVEKHGGTAQINPHYTDGCEIDVELPYLDMEPQITPPLGEEASELEGVDTEDVETAKPTVLVVEDTADMLEFLARNLGAHYNILTARNGREALDSLDRHSVGLVLSDIVMPEMDGFELLKAVRADDMLCHTPFILLSAQDSLDSKIAGLDYGADAYIEKPFTLSHIRATINNVLENRRLMFKHFATNPAMQYEHTGMNRTDTAWLEQLNETIRRELINPDFTIERLAEEMAMSRSNLQRKLKGLTGTPPNDYIRLIRLKIAAQLLQEGAYRVNEVCYIVGFNNHSYFARCFQKQFGILPKEYAKKHG